MDFFRKPNIPTGTIDTILRGLLLVLDNQVHSYDRAQNVNGNGITHARKFVHNIDSSA